MSSIQLYINTGSQAGRRLSFAAGPVRFGRGGDNDVVIDHPAVSRHHGELRLEDDRWVLQNLSRNTTWAGRRPARKRPVALREGDAVAVGDVELFHVSLQPARPSVEEEVPEEDRIEAEADAEQTRLAAQAKRRSRLMIGVGAYLAAMVVLFVMLSQLGGDNARNDQQHVHELRPHEVASILARDLTEDQFQPPSPSEAEDLIEGAIERYHSRPVPTDGDLYEAYSDLRRAMALLNIRNINEFEESRHRLEALEIRHHLTRRIQEMFEQANAAFYGQRDYVLARERFNRIMRLIQDPEDPLYRNARDHVARARALDDGRRR